MGRFSSSQQIYNAERLTKAQFKKMFGSALRQKGYTVCSEDSAEISYTLIFSKDRKWVSVLNPEYQPGAENVLNDAGFFAEALKTNVVSVGLVDSDFAELKLFDSSGKLADTLILGESYMDEPSPTGKKELWQPLLTENGTWEQVTEIQNGSYIFAEDALESFAQLIGMDGEQIMLDNEDTDDSAMVIYFKKAGEKKLTLNAAFKQVFGEALEPLGFVKIKVAKLTYFVRVVNDEILHILTYRELRTRKTGYKSFEILGGVVSLYRRTIDFTKSPECWLKNNHHYYCSLNPEIDDDVMESAVQYVCDVWGKSMDWFVRTESLEGAFSKSIVHFLYKSDDIYGMKNAFNVTQNVMLPIFDEAINLNNCIEHFYKLGTPMDICCDLEKFNTEPHYYYSEGLLLIKTGYKGDIMPYMENILAMKVKEVEKGLSGLTGAIDINDYKNRYRQKVQQQIIIRDQMLNDAELNTKVTAELKKRRTDNIRTLKSFGLEI